MHFILKWVINALALIAVTYFIRGVEVENFYIALVIAIVLGLLNILFKPIILILTLPINILTLGLFTFLINGFLFWFASTFIKGFYVDGFWAAIFGALVFSVFSYIGNTVLN